MIELTPNWIGISLICDYIAWWAPSVHCECICFTMALSECARKNMWNRRSRTSTMSACTWRTTQSISTTRISSNLPPPAQRRVRKGTARGRCCGLWTSFEGNTATTRLIGCGRGWACCALAQFFLFYPFYQESKSFSTAIFSAVFSIFM